LFQEAVQFFFILPVHYLSSSPRVACLVRSRPRIILSAVNISLCNRRSSAPLLDTIPPDHLAAIFIPTLSFLVFSPLFVLPKAFARHGVPLPMPTPQNISQTIACQGRTPPSPSVVPSSSLLHPVNNSDLLLEASPLSSCHIILQKLAYSLGAPPNPSLPIFRFPSPIDDPFLPLPLRVLFGFTVGTTSTQLASTGV